MILRLTLATELPPDSGDLWIDSEHIVSVAEGWVTEGGTRVLTARLQLYNGGTFLVYDRKREVGPAVSRAKGNYDVEIIE